MECIRKSQSRNLREVHSTAHEELSAISRTVLSPLPNLLCNNYYACSTTIMAFLHIDMFSHAIYQGVEWNHSRKLLSPLCVSPEDPRHSCVTIITPAQER